MRARVLDAVATLNYRRNSIASSIRRLDQRTASIGLIVEDLANPFASLLTRVVQDYALERAHLVLVGSSDGVADRERGLVAEFSSRRVDGLIVMPSGARGGVGKRAGCPRGRTTPCCAWPLADRVSR
jgi:LacI family transcriptional regulator